MVAINETVTKGPVINYGEGGGGATKREGRGGQVKFYPYKKGVGAEQVLAMLMRGHNKF